MQAGKLKNADGDYERTRTYTSSRKHKFGTRNYNFVFDARQRDRKA